MNITLCFSICSLFYCILLITNLFSKTKNKTVERKLLSILTIINFVTLSCETFGIYLGTNYEKFKLLNDVILRMMNIFYILFFSIFILFILNLSKQREYKKVKLDKIIYIIAFIASLINLFLPINYNVNDAGVIIYSSGPAVNMVYYYVMACEAICLLIMFKNHNKTAISNYSSLFLLVILTALAGIIQSYYPSILLSASTNTFVLLFTYINIVRKKLYNTSLSKEDE